MLSIGVLIEGYLLTWASHFGILASRSRTPRSVWLNPLSSLPVFSRPQSFSPQWLTNGVRSPTIHPWPWSKLWPAWPLPPWIEKNACEFLSNLNTGCSTQRFWWRSHRPNVECVSRKQKNYMRQVMIMNNWNFVDICRFFGDSGLFDGSSEGYISVQGSSLPLNTIWKFVSRKFLLVQGFSRFFYCFSQFKVISRC